MVSSMPGGYLQVPWQLLRNPTISTTDKVVLAYLICKFNKAAGAAWPSTSLIGKTLQMSQQTASASIQRLAAKKIITIIPMYRGRCNGYRLHLDVLTVDLCNETTPATIPTEDLEL